MKYKSEVYSIFVIFQKMVESLFDMRIRIFQSDREKECDNIPLQSYFQAHSIIFQNSCPRTPEQNGVAERKHHHIVEVA